jgi:hypothetical protein
LILEINYDNFVSPVVKTNASLYPVLITKVKYAIDLINGTL